MVFNSLPFLVFLPVVFLIYWFVVNRNVKVQNGFVLLASYVFYGWWDWWFLSLIVVSSATDFLVGMKIAEADDKQLKKRWLTVSLVINLSILGFFKYFNFFVESFVDLFALGGIHLNITTLNILLPVGISFYTFQSLSYTIDIYRDKIKPSRDPVAFFAFVAFFPQLVAGPIERAANLLPQFSGARNFNYAQAASGCRLILWGMFKKIVIADGLAHTVELVYSSPYEYSGWIVFFATVCFTFQVYADFSGYSDIAIGVARLFGFDLMTNFRTPLFSKTLQEFWHRWHISLSTWFRDYFYISIGGNRVSAFRWAVNLYLTFLLSGLWHGASMNFVVWGSIHGIIFSAEAIVKRYNLMNISLPRIVQMWYPFFVFTFTLIFFRAETTGEAFYMASALFDFSGFMGFEALTGAIKNLFISNAVMWQMLVSFCLFFCIDIMINKKDFSMMVEKFSLPVRWGFYYGLTFWILYFGRFDVEPTFVYFQF